MKQKTLKYPGTLTSIFLALALSLFILYPGSGGYQTIQQAKFYLFILLFGGYLFLMLLFTAEMLLLKRIRYISPRNLWQKTSTVQKLIFFYWVGTALSAVLSPHFPDTLLGMGRNEGLLTVTVYCGCFLCISSFASFERWLIPLLGAVMSAFCVLCLIQMGGLNPFTLYPAGYSYFDADKAYAGVYLGTIGNAGLVAALLCLMLPIFAVLLLRERGTQQLLLAIPVILSLTVLLLMDVKAGILALLAGMPLVICVTYPANRNPRIRWWLFAGVLVVFLAAFLWICVGSFSEGMLYELQQVLHGNWDPSFGTNRIYIWQNVWARLPQRLLLGIGPDTMAAAGIMMGSDNSFVVDVAHNEYLNVLYQQGLVAFLPYIAALLISAVRWAKYSSKSLLVAALGSGVLLYCIQAFFSFSMCPSAGLFWIVWALLENTVNKEVKS